jgi:uncharacterized membrane protein
VPVGAKAISFVLNENIQGTILGTAINPYWDTLDLPFNPTGYEQVDYTITQGSLTILIIR